MEGFKVYYFYFILSLFISYLFNGIYVNMSYNYLQNKIFNIQLIYIYNCTAACTVETSIFTERKRQDPKKTKAICGIYRIQANTLNGRAVYKKDRSEA